MSDQYHRDERGPDNTPQQYPEVRIPAPAQDVVAHPAQRSAASPTLPLQRATADPSATPGQAQVRAASERLAASIPAPALPTGTSSPPSSMKRIEELSDEDLDEIAQAAVAHRRPKWEKEFDRIKVVAVGLQKRGMTLAEIHKLLTERYGCRLPYKQLCEHMPTKRKRKSSRSA